MKEYNIHNEMEITKKYSTRAAKWYRNKHLAVLDGVIYSDTKPVKDFNDGYRRTKEVMKNVKSSSTAQKLSQPSNFEKKAAEKISKMNIKGKFKSLWGKVTGKKAQQTSAVEYVEEEG
jgi:hypothetical protein